MSPCDQSLVTYNLHNPCDNANACVRGGVASPLKVGLSASFPSIGLTSKFFGDGDGEWAGPEPLGAPTRCPRGCLRASVGRRPGRTAGVRRVLRTTEQLGLFSASLGKRLLHLF